MELDELGTLPQGRVQVVLKRNRPELDRCLALTRKGKSHGAEGQFESALECFREASAIDAYDPDPHYQCAVSLCWLERFSEAAAEYQCTESLAPGWFRCRAEGWLAREIAAGRIPRESEVFAGLNEIS